MTTKSSASNTLFGGDRTGSNYQYVMENAPVTLTGNAFSGRFNPGFRDNITAFVINPFVKFSGLEVFGTFEWAKGNSALENGEGQTTPYAAEDDRKAQQTAVEALYRFGKDEQFYVGARYITVTATIAEGYTAAAAGTRYDVTIDRTSFGAGWFITRNILLKGEYVTQNYNGYKEQVTINGNTIASANNRFFNGKFDGFVIQGAISF
jgi:hypothetical protein